MAAQALDQLRGRALGNNLAMIDDGPRSAAALASEPSELAIVDKSMFLMLVRVVVVRRILMMEGFSSGHPTEGCDDIVELPCFLFGRGFARLEIIDEIGT